MIAAGAVAVLFSPSSFAAVSPNQCTPAPEVKTNLDCGAQGEDSSVCDACKQKLEDQKLTDKLNSAKTATTSCNQQTCPGASAVGDPNTTRGSHHGAGGAMGAAAACMKEKVGFNQTVSGAAKSCLDAVKACKGLKADANKQIVQSDKEACQTAKTDADDTAKDQQKKGDEAQKNAEKDDKNEKKDGGGMPQMPQIPQMPQNQDSQPDTSTATNPSITSDPSTGTAGGMETSKLDGGSFGSPGVGFGSSGTNTNTSTTTDGPSYTTPTNAPVNMAGLLGGASPLGSGGSGGGFGSFGGGGGGAAGGGGSQNTTGASAPGPTGSASSTDSPYEVGGGGGGKLGAPKGFKSGGDSDSAIADAAKGDFKADVGDAARNPAGETVAQAGDEESDGFTVFKMVHSRYIEIKKRGSL